MQYELVFGWISGFSTKVTHCSVEKKTNFVPRIGETINLGYVEEYDEFIEKKVTNVVYNFNTDDIYIELES